MVAAATLLAGHFAEKAALSRIGRVGVAASAAALLACCGVLVFCFMTGDVSIKYVLEERTLSTDGLAWLYKLSGLWAGRAGSLLFWVFLIALFNAVILTRSSFGGKRFGVAHNEPQYYPATYSLDNLTMAIVAIVVATFCGVLLFSEGNMPFAPTPASYFTAGPDEVRAWTIRRGWKAPSTACASPSTPPCLSHRPMVGPAAWPWKPIG